MQAGRTLLFSSFFFFFSLFFMLGEATQEHEAWDKSSDLFLDDEGNLTSFSDRDNVAFTGVTVANLLEDVEISLMTLDGTLSVSSDAGSKMTAQYIQLAAGASLSFEGDTLAAGYQSVMCSLKDSGNAP